MHPRSLLDELLRLGLAAHDTTRDTVRLVREAFVPQGDEARLLRVLGRNVGDHLAGAVDNLLHDNRRHFEQAVYADGLSDTSMAEFRRLVGDQWQATLSALVPALESMVARDAAATAATAAPDAAATPDAAADADAAASAAVPRHRVRLGLYSFAQIDPPAADAIATDAPVNDAPANDAPATDPEGSPP